MSDMVSRLRPRGFVAAAALLLGLAAPAQAIELEMPSYQLEEGFGPWWLAAAEAFAEENPGHSIKLVNVPFGAHHDGLTTRFVAGNPPDLAHISARFYFGYADQGFLEPLDERLAEIAWKEEDFISAQAGLRRDGKTYAQLLLGYGWGLFYNADMLAEAGVEVPTTREELMAAAAKLTRDRDGDGRVDQYGLVIGTDKSSQTHMNLSYFLAGLGHGWVEDGKLVDKAVLREALALTQELVSSQASPAGLAANPMRQLFWQGNAAMYIDGSWAVAYRKDATDAVKAAYRVAPLPFPDEAGGPSNVLAIPAALSDERKELAFKFVELIQRPEWQQRYAEISGNPPARLGMMNDAIRTAWPELEVFEASTGRATKSYLPEGQEGNFAKWSAIVGDGVTGLVSGTLSLDEAVDMIHGELTAEFF